MGLVFATSFGWTNSGLINEEDAPVSMRNFKGRPNGEEIFMYGRINPCLLTSRYPTELLRRLVENPRRLQRFHHIDVLYFHG